MKKTRDGNCEQHGIVVKIARLFTVPLLNALPASFVKKMMRASSHDAATVVAKGGSTHALEAMYTRYHRGLFSRGFLQGIADAFWHHFVSQPKALRNRLHIVQSLLEDEIKSRLNASVSILSIAGGSARALAHTVAKLHLAQNAALLQIVVLDKDASALETGKRIAAELGVAENFQWICGNASETQQLVPARQYDMVEIVGLLDYFDDERVVRLITTIKRAMKKNAVLIAANVTPNTETPFVRKTGWPPMYYRTPDNFTHLITRAGYVVHDTIQEPLGVHVVLRANVS